MRGRLALKKLRPYDKHQFVRQTKGKIRMIEQYGLTYDLEVLVSIPHIFNMEDHAVMNKTKDLVQYIDNIVRIADQDLSIEQKLRQAFLYVWPLLIRNADPTKFTSYLKCLQNQIKLSPQYVCFIIHYAQKYQEQYPSFCVAQTLNHFQVPQQEVDYQPLIDAVVGQQCFQALMLAKALNPRTQLQKYEHSEERVSSLNIALARMLLHKKNVLRIIGSLVGRYEALISKLDCWLAGSCHRNVAILRVCKLVMLVESIVEYRSKLQHEQPKMQFEAINGAVIECCSRLFHKVFGYDLLVGLVILEWALSSKIIETNENLRKHLLYFLICCHQIIVAGRQNSPDTCLKHLFIKYIQKIKQKYYQEGLIAYKLPRFFSKLTLSFLDREAEPYQQSPASTLELQPNPTGTISLNKIEKEEPRVLGRLISMLNHEAQKLCLHKVYLLGMGILQELATAEVGPGRQGTDMGTRRQDITGVYYRATRCMQKYEQIYGRNRLSDAAVELFSRLLPFVGEISMTQGALLEFPDLQLLSNEELMLENISNLILKNPIEYSLKTIFHLEHAQLLYNKTMFSAMNTNTSKKQEHRLRNNKHTVQLVIDKSGSDSAEFINCLYQMAQTLTKKKEDADFMTKLICIRDHQINNILYLNLIYYICFKQSKGITAEKERKKRVLDLDRILKRLIPYYFLDHNTTPEYNRSRPDYNKSTPEYNKIIATIGTAHKLLENWSSSTRSSFGQRNLEREKFVFESGQQDKSISQMYWEMLITSTEIKNMNVYARKMETINCVKESIYLMEAYGRRVFPAAYTQDEIEWMYGLYSRLDQHVSECRPYVQERLGWDHFRISSIPLSEKDTSPDTKDPCHNKGLQDYEMLKTLLCNPYSHELFMCLLRFRSQKILGLEDAEEISKLLMSLSVFYKFVDHASRKKFEGIKQILENYNDEDFCCSIIRCLEELKLQMIEESVEQQKVREVSAIIYEAKLRFRLYNQLQAQLGPIRPQKMSPEQLRTIVVLFSRLQQHQKVIMYCKYFKNLRMENKPFKQQIELLNMQAYYRGVMSYSPQMLVNSLSSLIGIIVEIPDSEKVNHASTYPLFEAIKFLFQSYKRLDVSLEVSIIGCLNKYLKFVYQIRNHRLSVEAAYFVLRFIFIESSNTDRYLKDERIFPYDDYNAAIFVPHRWLLINSISEGQSQQQALNSPRNRLIMRILVRIAQHDPISSSWWLFEMVNHTRVLSSKQKVRYNEQDKVIEAVGHAIEEQLAKKKHNMKPYLDWIESLLICESEKGLKSIPPKMVSPFDSQVTLLDVVSVTLLNSGKSRPTKIEFKVTKEKLTKTIIMIRKQITSEGIDFRTQSATANFFKDVGLVDQSVTYSIIHLCKARMLIEYISHESTLDSLMMDGIGESELYKLKKYLEKMEQKEIKAMKIFGQFYDTACDINFSLNKFFLKPGAGSLIKNWWCKYTNFVKTWAQWSYLCYIIGLGDRHNNNILVAHDGKVIHIDFEYIFDMGKLLPAPEWVPFRLTKGLVQQLSVIEPYGLICSEFINTAKRYKQKAREIWQAESHFSFYKNIDISTRINKRAQFKDVLQDTFRLFETATTRILQSEMFKGWGCYK